MKKFFIILGIVGAVLYAAHYFGLWTLLDGSQHDYRRELDSLRQEVLTLRRGQIEIKEKLDSIADGQSAIKSDLDTLKSGQEVIFNEVRKTAERSFWDYFK